MFEQKHLELSTEDYQNYTYNENALEGRMNKANITEVELYKLYTEVQQKSRNNKKIKNQALMFESKLYKILMEKDYPAKQLGNKYIKYKNQLKLYLSDIFDQLSLLHVKNLSTTIEFMISRHFVMQEKLIQVICKNKNQIDRLNQIIEKLQLSNTSHLCIGCNQNIHQVKNKFIVNHIIAGETQSTSFQPNRYEPAQISRKDLRREFQTKKYEEDQFELQGHHLKMCIDNTLRNRQKTLQHTNAPVQNILTDYMAQILKIIEDTKVLFGQQPENYYEKMPRPYDNIEQMRTYIDHSEFNKKVNLLLAEPYKKLIKNIQKYITPENKRNIKRQSTSTQTLYLKQHEQISNLQRHKQRLNSQLQQIKLCKNKKQKQLSVLLQNNRKHQLKILELMNKTRSAQNDLKKSLIELMQVKQRYSELQKIAKDDLNRLMDINLNERNVLYKKVKQMWEQISIKNEREKEYITSQIEKKDKCIQTQIEDNLYHVESIQKPSRQLKKRNNTKRHNKVSLLLSELTARKNSNLQRQNIAQIIEEKSFIAKQEGNPIQSRVRLQSSSKHRSSKKIISLSNLKGNQTPLVNIQSKQNNAQAHPPKSKFFNIKSQNASRNISKKTTRHGYHHSQLASVKSDRNSIQCESSTNFNLFNGKTINMNANLQNQQTKNNKINNYISQIKRRRKVNTSELSKQIAVKCSEQARQNTLQYLIELIKQNINKMITSEQRQAYLDFQIVCNKFYNQLKRAQIIKMINEKQTPSNQKGFIDKKQFLEIEVKRFGGKFIQLFFGLKQAEKYQQQIGIWNQMENYVSVDNKYKKLIDKISQHFFILKIFNPKAFYQCIFFLKKPFDYWHILQKNILSEQAIEKIQIEQKELKHILKRLINLHKMVHKRCNHVQHFLEFIGFKQ